jgi:anti-sigma regulatory factor (Ser/Thr protein kinase)
VVPDTHLRLPPDARAPAHARRSLETLRPSLDDRLAEEAALLVTEVVSNSVRHASLDASETIEVRIRGSRSTLHVDVIDPGPGFDPSRPRRSRQTGGWGLWLLDRLATRWGVERNGMTRVWFELSSSPVSTDPASGTRGADGEPRRESDG